MLTTAKIILAFLPLVRWIFQQIDRAQLRASIRAEVVAEQLAAITERLGLANDVRARIDAMSDAEVDAELRKQGDFRDGGPQP